VPSRIGSVRFSPPNTEPKKTNATQTLDRTSRLSIPHFLSSSTRPRRRPASCTRSPPSQTPPPPFARPRSPGRRGSAWASPDHQPHLLVRAIKRRSRPPDSKVAVMEAKIDAVAHIRSTCRPRRPRGARRQDSPTTHHGASLKVLFSSLHLLMLSAIAEFQPAVVAFQKKKNQL
jgi:hypothetical protein